jgi:hypothetical protein
MNIFPTTILLATDGSQDAELARTTAVDMATTTDSEVARRDRRSPLSIR